MRFAIAESKYPTSNFDSIHFSEDYETGNQIRARTQLASNNHTVRMLLVRYETQQSLVEGALHVTRHATKNDLFFIRFLRVMSPVTMPSYFMRGGRYPVRDVSVGSPALHIRIEATATCVSCRSSGARRWLKLSPSNILKRPVSMKFFFSYNHSKVSYYLPTSVLITLRSFHRSLRTTLVKVLDFECIGYKIDK